MQTFENYPDNAHTRVIFKGSAEPATGPTPSVNAAPIEKQISSSLNKNNDDDENHESEYSSYSSSSSDDGYHYDKPIKETKKLFTAAENDGDYKVYQNPGSGFEISFQPSSYSDYDGEQSQQKDVNEKEPYSYSYSTLSTSGSSANNGDRSKKSKNSNNPSKIRMRVPKSLRQSMRDKREKMDD